MLKDHNEISFYLNYFQCYLIFFFKKINSENAHYLIIFNIYYYFFLDIDFYGYTILVNLYQYNLFLN